MCSFERFDHCVQECPLIRVATLHNEQFLRLETPGADHSVLCQPIGHSMLVFPPILGVATAADKFGLRRLVRVTEYSTGVEAYPATSMTSHAATGLFRSRII
jgi:hypothetical protein